MPAEVPSTRLVLLRHGEAERLAARDEDRVLTLRGREEAELAARSLQQAGYCPARIGASYFVRARQTAAIVAGYFPGANAEPVTLDRLTPDDDPRAALRSLDAFLVPGATVLVATHMPLIGSLAGLLTEGDAAACAGFATGCGVVLAGDLPHEGLCRIETVIGRQPRGTRR